jgi:nucleoside-diphosphate-sugar epimerase
LQKPVVLSSPDVELDYVFSQDVACAIDLALDRDVPGGIANIGGGDTVKISGLVDEIGRITGKGMDVSYTNRLRKGDPLRKLSDISLAKEALGWEPATALKEGLAKTIEWYKSSMATG